MHTTPSSSPLNAFITTQRLYHHPTPSSSPRLHHHHSTPSSSPHLHHHHAFIITTQRLHHHSTPSSPPNAFLIADCSDPRAGMYIRASTIGSQPGACFFYIELHYVSNVRGLRCRRFIELNAQYLMALFLVSAGGALRCYIKE